MGLTVARGRSRRQRAAAQRPAPRGVRETAPRPVAAAKPRPGVTRLLVRHLLWFLPLYAGLLSAAYLARTFYATGLQDPRRMLGALAALSGGLLLEYPWARWIQRREDRGLVLGKPQKEPTGSRP